MSGSSTMVGLLQPAHQAFFVRPAYAPIGENSRTKLQNVVADSTAISKRQHLLLKVEDVQINHVDRDNLGTRRAHPAARRGARNAPSSRMADITRRPDKITKSMIIPLLNASLGNHGAMVATAVGRANANCVTPTQVQQHPFASPEYVSSGGNSRRKAQNVVADSTGRRQAQGRHSSPPSALGDLGSRPPQTSLSTSSGSSWN